MKRFESDIEKKVARRFEEALYQYGLIVLNQDKWQTSLMIRRFDIVIYKNFDPIVVIEVKGSIEKKDILAKAKDQVRSAISITNSRFGIVTDNIEFFIYDVSNRDLDFLKVSFDDIISRISRPERIEVSKKDKESVLKSIVDSADKHLKSNSDFLKFIKNKSLLNKIHFDKNTNTYCFADDGEGLASYENQLFSNMFGEFTNLEICRYTSLKTIFEMINNISFRMSGLMGMNDKTEVNYVESYLNRGNNEISIAKPLIKEHFNTIKAINDRFITSCTTIKRKDDLTLWRLYSEDAQGVCLIFDVKKNNLSNYVFLQKVKYADEKGIHAELNFIKQIIEDVVENTGYKFEFRKLDQWKHFFKAYDYRFEDEVRLLLIDNDALLKIKSDWVMSFTHSIITPVIEFKLNSKSFPIQLKEIILGPKCPEKETNLVQLREMIRRKNQESIEKTNMLIFNDIKIALSNIKHYR